MFNDKYVRGLPVGGILTTLASFMSLLMLGAFYTFGNLMPYLVSYMRNATGEDITYSQFNNVNLAFGISAAVGQTIAPIVLVPLIGYKNIMLLGGIITFTGCLLTRWALEVNLLTVTLSYGFLQGLGDMAFIPDFFVPMKWFPKHSGLVMGICIGGYGISSTMWSPIQLAIANPNNVEAVTPPGSEEAYFEDEDVLKRVPILLYTMSAFYGVFLTAAYILTSEPTEDEATKKKPKQFWELDYKKAFAGLKENVFNRRQFYLIMGVRFGYIIAAYTLPAYYKAFGLALHYDDAFITTWVTTLSGISQLMSRFILASFLDITPFRLLVGLQTIIVLACFLGLYSVAQLGSIPYVLWMHLFFLTYPGIFAILPPKGREEFGEKYGPLVVGSITLSDIIVLLSIGIISNAILTEKIGSYLTYFLVMASGPLIALICVALFPNSEKDRRNWQRMKKCGRSGPAAEQDALEAVEIKKTDN